MLPSVRVSGRDQPRAERLPLPQVLAFYLDSRVWLRRYRRVSYDGSLYMHVETLQPTTLPHTVSLHCCDILS